MRVGLRTLVSRTDAHQNSPPRPATRRFVAAARRARRRIEWLDPRRTRRRAAAVCVMVLDAASSPAEKPSGEAPGGRAGTVSVHTRTRGDRIMKRSHRRHRGCAHGGEPLSVQVSGGDGQCTGRWIACGQLASAVDDAAASPAGADGNPDRAPVPIGCPPFVHRVCGQPVGDPGEGVLLRRASSTGCSQQTCPQPVENRRIRGRTEPVAYRQRVDKPGHGVGTVFFRGPRDDRSGAKNLVG